MNSRSFMLCQNMAKCHILNDLHSFLLIFKTLNIVGFFLYLPPRHYILRNENLKKYMRGNELCCYFCLVPSPVANLTIYDEPGTHIKLSY